MSKGFHFAGDETRAVGRAGHYIQHDENNVPHIDTPHGFIAIDGPYAPNKNIRVRTNIGVFVDNAKQPNRYINHKVQIHSASCD